MQCLPLKQSGGQHSYKQILLVCLCFLVLDRAAYLPVSIFFFFTSLGWFVGRMSPLATMTGFLRQLAVTFFHHPVQITSFSFFLFFPLHSLINYSLRQKSSI